MTISAARSELATHGLTAILPVTPPQQHSDQIGRLRSPPMTEPAAGSPIERQITPFCTPRLTAAESAAAEHIGGYRVPRRPSNCHRR
jgi:hypothetical protein